MTERYTAAIVAGLLGVATTGSHANVDFDWPLFRHDAARSAVTPHRLADELHPQWVRELPPPRRAWPWQQDDFEKLDFDVSYEPVVAGDTLFIGSMVEDRMTAYAIETGEKRWRYFTGGPARLAPVVWRDRVYAAADDGWLYCLDAARRVPGIMTDYPDLLLSLIKPSPQAGHHRVRTIPRTDESIYPCRPWLGYPTASRSP